MAPPSEVQIEQLKRALLRKGAEINERLVAVLSGKRFTIEGILAPGHRGESKEERLRRFLTLVDGRIKAIAAGTYGRCESCGDGLPFAHLEQVPWIDTCGRCASDAGTSA